MRSTFALMVTVLGLLTVTACGDDAELVVGGQGSTDDEVVSVPHRILADGVSTGDPWTTSVAQSDADLERFAPDTDVDWDAEVAFVFTLTESSSNPFGRVEDVRFDRTTLRLYPVVPLLADYEEGTDDANPHTVVVAVRRADLPEGDFSLWVDGDAPPAGAVDGVTHMAVGELEATDTEGPEGRPEPLRSDGTIGVGQVRLAHDVTTHCGLQFLFLDIDGRQWTVAGDEDLRIDWIPEEWEPEVDGESIDLRIERVEADRLEVTAPGTGHTLTYVPSPEMVGCD